jgi:agmatine deiminase
MPAEWEPHEATWLAWLHEKTDWPGKFAPIPWVYADIVRHLARVERVRILVQHRAEEESARRILRKAGADLAAVEFFRAATDRGWTRDFGPVFVRNDRGEVAATHWLFNGWAKYGDCKKDAVAFTDILRRSKMTVWQPRHPEGAKGRRIVLEGGSIDVNGRGTLMTTEECLLSPVQARNPALDRTEIEQVFRDYLGATHVLWLGRGIAGDDTHGHVDDLARFVDPTTIVTVVEANKSEANYEPLLENLARLREMRDQDGKTLRVVRLPMPEPVFFDRQRLPASYANFYIANRLVLVPAFNDPNDCVVLNILAELFPDRQVVPIPCRDLVLGLGTLHCMTQQQPT